MFGLVVPLNIVEAEMYHALEIAYYPEVQVCERFQTHHCKTSPSTSLLNPLSFSISHTLRIDGKAVSSRNGWKNIKRELQHQLLMVLQEKGDRHVLPTCSAEMLAIQLSNPIQLPHPFPLTWLELGAWNVGLN